MAKIKFAGIDDPKTTFEEALDQLAARYDLNCEINEVAFKRDLALPEVRKLCIANPNPIPKMEASFHTVLNRILSNVGNPRGVHEAVYVLRDEFVEITTRRAMMTEFYSERNPYEFLPPLVNAFLDKRPISAAIKELAAHPEVNLLFDPHCPKEARAAPVTAILKNVPLDTAIWLLTDMAGLKMIKMDNVYFVTTVETARRIRDENQEEKKHDQ